MQQTDIKIAGDSSEAVAAIEEVGRAAEATQSKLENTGRKGAEAGTKATGGWKDGLNLFKDLLPRNLQMLQRRFESTSRQVGRMGGSFKILGAAIKAVPIFLIVEGFRWIIDNWEKISDFFTGTTAGMKAMKEAAKAGSDAVNEFTNSTQFLSNIVENSTASLTARNQALRELQKIMPELQGLTLEQAVSEERLSNAIRENIRLEGLRAEQKALQQALLEAEAQAVEQAEKQWYDYLGTWGYLVSALAGQQSASKDVADITERLTRVTGELIYVEGKQTEAANAAAQAERDKAEALRKAEEAARKAAQDAKARAEMARKLDREITLAKIADDRDRARKELEYARADELEKAKAIGAGQELIDDIYTKYRLELKEMEAGWAKEDKAILDQEAEARDAFWEEQLNRQQEFNLSERELAEKRLGDELTEQMAQLDKLKMTAEEKANALKAIEDQYLLELTELREKYRKEDADAETKARADYEAFFFTDKEKKLADIETEYQEQLAIATKYGLETVKLEEWKAKQIAAIEEEAAEESRQYADERFQAIQGFANEVSSLFGQLADLSEEGSKNQRKLAIAEVLLSQAQAMASAIRGAAAAAAAAGPGAPFALAGYIASMIGTVVAAFSSIKRIMGAPQGNEPDTASRPISQALIPNVAPPTNPQFNIGPVQAYVVESQMQAQLNMTAGIARRARL
jgi:hypothetical protein